MVMQVPSWEWRGGGELVTCGASFVIRGLVKLQGRLLIALEIAKAKHDQIQHEAVMSSHGLNRPSKGRE